VSNAIHGNVIMKRRVVPPILTTLPNTKQTSDDPSHQHLPTLATAQLGEQDEMFFKEGVAVTGPIRDKKKPKDPAVVSISKRRKKTLSKPRHDDLHMPGLDNFICSGDVLVKQRPTPKLLENKFAASISAVKPSRRVVNVMPAAQIVQKG